MRVEYHPAVESELKEIRTFYDERSPGLGAAFVDEFERQVLQFAATPGVSRNIISMNKNAIGFLNLGFNDKAQNPSPSGEGHLNFDLAADAPFEILRKTSQNLSPAGVTSPFTARAMPTDPTSVVPVSGR